MDHWITGMDLSTLQEVERCGGRFYDHDVQKDAMEILRSYGMNMVRLRLWNDPFDADGNPYGAGGNDIETVLALAKRGAARGAGWLLDIHYSDFWGDPGKQIVPKAWQGLDGSGLERMVYSYTCSVLERCRTEEILPQMVAVGNEITNGLLWPYGKVPEYKNIVRLINAGIRAVREADPGIKVMLHLDNGGNNALYRDWFDHYIGNGGADFDCIGLSYYPFWHGTMQMLRDNMHDIAQRYQKDLIVAEVSMGYTTEDYGAYEQLSDTQRKGMATTPELVEKIGYPMTPEGQVRFMRDIMQIIRGVPNGRGKGFFYWEPAWIPVPGSGWAERAGWEYVGEKGPGGNEWANQALFDYDGNALPALEAIREYAGAAV